MVNCSCTGVLKRRNAIEIAISHTARLKGLNLRLTVRCRAAAIVGSSVSATAAPAAWRRALGRSRTHVRNQRRISSHVIGFCNVMRMGYILGPPGTSPTVQLPELRSAACSGAGPREDRLAPGGAVFEAAAPV